jgi:hypothetical protein
LAEELQVYEKGKDEEDIRGLKEASASSSIVHTIKIKLQ